MPLIFAPLTSTNVPIGKTGSVTPGGAVKVNATPRLVAVIWAVDEAVTNPSTSTSSISLAFSASSIATRVNTFGAVTWTINSIRCPAARPTGSVTVAGTVIVIGSPSTETTSGETETSFPSISTS